MTEQDRLELIEWARDQQAMVEVYVKRKSIRCVQDDGAESHFFVADVVSDLAEELIAVLDSIKTSESVLSQVPR